MVKLRSATIALLWTAGTAIAADRPDWISGESLEWPRHKYVLGVGSADDRTTAEDRARAEVARVFTARVVSTTSSYASEAKSVVNGRESSSSEVAASDATRSSTDKVLEGVEIAAVFEDRAAHQVFALAALDKRKAAERLRARLEAFDATAKPLEAQLAADGDAVDRAIAGLRLMNIARRRENLVTDLRIVDPRAEVGAARYAKLVSAAEAALSALVVVEMFSGEEGTAIAEGVTRGLAVLGLRARSDPATPGDLAVEATASTEDLGRRDGWYWSKTNATVTIREVRSSRVLVQFDESAREAATLLPEARRRAATSAAARVADRVPAGFMAWADTR